MLATLTLLPERIPTPDAYPFNVPAILSLRNLTFAPARLTFFTGENGSGKSTLLEAIALSYGLSLDGGNRNFAFDPTFPPTTPTRSSAPSNSASAPTAPARASSSAPKHSSISPPASMSLT